MSPATSADGATVETVFAGAPPKPPSHPVVLRAARLLDLDTRSIVEPGVVVVQGEHILDVSPTSVPDDAGCDARQTLPAGAAPAIGSAHT